MSKALFSARIGINKPSPRAFEAALAAAGSSRPEKTLFVDDRHDNCAVASQLGMQALHFDGDPNTLARRLPQPLPLAPPSRCSVTARCLLWRLPQRRRGRPPVEVLPQRLGVQHY
ncbi:HAD-IA family hydrolase [Streptomyces sp. NPDC005708]|uniref:HAD-IA family hydrolase n=1 Tax=Streptomyces sp. NPDC005708 TaxID=3154564 RepID=UPI0033C1C7D7